MNVVLAVTGKFHHFDLARQLQERDVLGKIFTTYPRWKLSGEGLPEHKVETFPWILVPYFAWLKAGGAVPEITRHLEKVDRLLFGRYLARNLPACDALIAISGGGLEAAQLVKSRGAAYVCDRGSTHIRHQENVLREEHERLGLAFTGAGSFIIQREEAEYQLADVITVPSRFAERTFQQAGIGLSKVRRIPYGVNLERFTKVCDPPEDEFRVLYVGAGSIRKGLIYLLRGFEQLDAPKKRLQVVGPLHRDLMQLARRYFGRDDIEFTGFLPQTVLKRYMSGSHVMVLPSIEEGLALVQAQALACGCPVIATPNTGAEDLFVDGKEGFIVPIRDPNAISEKLQFLFDNPETRLAMSRAALARVAELGGWGVYGDQMLSLLRELVH